LKTNLTPRKDNVEEKLKTKKTLKKAKEHQLPVMSSVINDHGNWRTSESSKAFIITTTGKLKLPRSPEKQFFMIKNSLLHENNAKKIDVEDT